MAVAGVLVVPALAAMAAPAVAAPGGRTGPSHSLAATAQGRGGGAAAGGTWGTAVEVPGTAALNTGGFAQAGSVSCGAVGNCAAVGPYRDAKTLQLHAFVVSQAGDAWGTASNVPGLPPGGSNAEAVSCASAGNCSAVGYEAGRGGQAPLAVGEVNGVWGNAQHVTAPAGSGLSTVSCASAGMCSAGGAYFYHSQNYQAIVVGEVNGTWGTAEVVPGIAVLNTGRNASVTSVSCASAGNCGAGGSYSFGAGHKQAYVVSQAQGTWGTATKVPGIAALNTGRNATITSVSCASAGNCSAGGYYSALSGNSHAFVVGEVNGTWGTAIEVPGIAALGRRSQLASVSCASAGNCSAGGYYVNHSGNEQAFVVDEVNGTWGTAIEVPGTAALNVRVAAIDSVSCPAPGDCGAGGFYTDRSGHEQAFVVDEVNGTWGTAIEVPGTAVLNAGGGAGVVSVSCPAPGECSAGGSYTDSSGNVQAFVVTET